MLWCYLRSPLLLSFPSAVLRHGQECREGQRTPWAHNTWPQSMAAFPGLCSLLMATST